jgi:hypothetical protein
MNFKNAVSGAALAIAAATLFAGVLRPRHKPPMKRMCTAMA